MAQIPEPADLVIGGTHGELDPELFPVPAHLQPANAAGGAPSFETPLAFLLDQLAKWIAEGLAKVDGTNAPAIPEENRPAAVRHWALYRGFTSILMRLSGSAGSVSLGTLSRSFSSRQIETWEQLRDEHLAAFEAVAASTLVPPTTGFGALRPERAEAPPRDEYSAPRGAARGGQGFAVDR